MQSEDEKHGPMNIYIVTMLHANMLMISEYYKLLQIKDMSSQDPKSESEGEETKKLLGITNMRRRYKFLSSISQVCAFLQCING